MKLQTFYLDLSFELSSLSCSMTLRLFSLDSSLVSFPASAKHMLEHGGAVLLTWVGEVGLVAADGECIAVGGEFRILPS